MTTHERWDRFKNAAVRDQVATLETAVAYALSAKVMVPKSLAGLLADAGAKCRLFESLRAAEKQATVKRRESQVKGGKKRQDNLRPAREYALRLARSMQPEWGWKTAGEAARAVYPQTVAFITRNKMALSREDSLIRTIRNWFRTSLFATV